MNARRTHGARGSMELLNTTFPDRDVRVTHVEPPSASIPESMGCSTARCEGTSTRRARQEQCNRTGGARLLLRRERDDEDVEANGKANGHGKAQV